MSAPVDVVVLCGGKGTRVARVIGNVPKPLAKVNGTPFLDRLLSSLLASGRVGRFLLAAGHLGDQVRERYGSIGFDVPVKVIVESEALGTGGAIRNALGDIKSSTFIVVNGDSFTDFSMACFLDAHARSGSDISILVGEIEDAQRYGSIECDPATNRILHFAEKGAARTHGLINYGAYAFQRDWAIRSLIMQKFSIEEFFASNVSSARIFAHKVSSNFIDIGTPESFVQSQNFFTQE